MTCLCTVFFFFNDTATTEIYTLSLHDALPIFHVAEALRPAVGVLIRAGDEFHRPLAGGVQVVQEGLVAGPAPDQDRKSTRLNSSHANISYAVFCLKKKTISCSLLYI